LTTLSAEIGKEGKKEIFKIFGFNAFAIVKVGINSKSNFLVVRVENM